jgi:hypothetical protein
MWNCEPILTRGAADVPFGMALEPMIPFNGVHKLPAHHQTAWLADVSRAFSAPVIVLTTRSIEKRWLI